ncbi:hypothetical protein BDV23DRAFT_178611 [Aspergillus alliaceus]|uniref:Uncharacterized protein n=1 Tax=Petromyces alliaceus TaxID=209559 RepID=A0A5N7CNU4_PETAA|nr:hypothetical protein BDV23DRAFT_178611 [Aspergillus alliaceus]
MSPKESPELANRILCNENADLHSPNDDNMSAGSDEWSVELEAISSSPEPVSRGEGNVPKSEVTLTTPPSCDEAVEETPQESGSSALEVSNSDQTRTADGVPTIDCFNALQLYAAYRLWLIRPFRA